MAAFLQRLRTEPAVVVATIVAALALFGVRVSDADAATITQIIVAVLPLAGGVVVRQRVTPVAKLDAERRARTLHPAAGDPRGEW